MVTIGIGSQGKDGGGAFGANCRLGFELRRRHVVDDLDSSVHHIYLVMSFH